MNQMKLNVEHVKANKRMENKNKAKANDIMDWAVRKQRAHDQMVLANMWFGMDKSKSKD